MLPCLGYNIPSDGSHLTRIFGDRLALILNAQNPASDLSKKHVVISFHVVREAINTDNFHPIGSKYSGKSLIG